MRKPISKALIHGYMAVSTSNVSDALDRLGIPCEPTQIGALWQGCKKIVGPAMTLTLAPLEKSHKEITTVVGTLQAIMDALPGDVLVIDIGGRMDLNTFGGVAGATTQHYGLAGVVCDGVSRDIDEYKTLDLPVFGKGFIHQSVRGRVGYVSHGTEAKLGTNTVRPGDLIVGDENGVVVVPHEQIEAVLQIARFVKNTEDSVIAAIRAGGDPIEVHQNVKYDEMLKRTA
jgi:regulator of RNase E activity RraA